LNDKQAAEYVNLCNSYFNLEKNLNERKTKISELAANFKIHQTAYDLNERQNSKLKDLSCAITNMDKIISLKTNLIQTLESELKYLDSSDDLVISNSQSASTQSSTSSLGSSVSQHKTIQRTTVFNDTESDTGISSANSDVSTSSTQLETLV
jgi:hypothetical protein